MSQKTFLSRDFRIDISAPRVGPEICLVTLKDGTVIVIDKEGGVYGAKKVVDVIVVPVQSCDSLEGERRRVPS